MLDVVLHYCFFFVWCLAINVGVHYYNGGLLPYNILLTQCYNHRGTRLNAMTEEVLYLQPTIPAPPTKRFDISPPCALKVWAPLDFFLKEKSPLDFHLEFNLD